MQCRDILTRGCTSPQAPYHCPDHLSPGGALIPHHLLKINASASIPVSGWNTSLWRFFDTPLFDVTVIPATPCAPALNRLHLS